MRGTAPPRLEPRFRRRGASPRRTPRRPAPSIVGPNTYDGLVGSAYEFMSDVSGRLKNRVQLTTDQHRAYLTAVEDAFAEVDYAQLHKLYTPATETEGRYSPPKCIGCREKIARGSRTTRRLSRSTSCITILGAFTRRCA